MAAESAGRAGDGGGGSEAQDEVALLVAQKRNSNAPEHRHLRAVAAALAEVIREQGLQPSPTAYFAAAMSALEREAGGGGQFGVGVSGLALSVREEEEGEGDGKAEGKKKKGARRKKGNRDVDMVSAGLESLGMKDGEEEEGGEDEEGGTQGGAGEGKNRKGLKTAAAGVAGRQQRQKQQQQQQQQGGSPEVTAALLDVLNLALPLVPVPIVRPRAPSVLTLLLALLPPSSSSSPSPGGGGDADMVGEEGGQDREDEQKHRRQRQLAENRVVRCVLSSVELVVGKADRGVWSQQLGNAFAAALRFSVDFHPKVRRKAQLTVQRLLQLLQRTPCHAPASLALVSWSESVMAAAVAPRAAPAAGTTAAAAAAAAATTSAAAAMATLHLLSGLRPVLPLLTAPALNRLLLRFVELLALDHPLVSQSVLESLLQFASSCPAAADASSPAGAGAAAAGAGNEAVGSAAAAAAVVVADVIAHVVRREEAWQAEQARQQRRADVGMVRLTLLTLRALLDRLHALDAAACRQRLPGVFHTLTDRLASEQEEVMYATAEFLRGLVVSFVDQGMVEEAQAAVAAQQQQQQQQAKKGKEADADKKAAAGVSPLQRLCSAAEKLVGYQYRSSWDYCLLIIATLFDRVGALSATIMANTVLALAELQALPDADMPCRKQLHAAIGSAIASMGPAPFLRMVPLNLDDPEGLSAARIWLFPLLKRHMVGAPLSFYAQVLLPQAARLRQRSSQALARKKPVEARNLEAVVAALWELLPAACHYACDTAHSFRLLAKPMAETAANEVALRPPIFAALKKLINQNKTRSGSRTVNGSKPPAAAAAGKSSRAQQQQPEEDDSEDEVEAGKSTKGKKKKKGSQQLTKEGGDGDKEETEGEKEEAEASVAVQLGGLGGEDGDGEGERTADEEEVEGEEDDATMAVQRARAAITPQVAEANIAAIAAFSSRFLPILFEAFMTAPPNRRADLQDGIAALASITPAPVLKSFFVTALQKQLEATVAAASAAAAAAAPTAGGGGAAAGSTGAAPAPDAAAAAAAAAVAGTARRVTLMDLTLALLSGPLEQESLETLYRATRPAIHDTDVSVQKRAYKLMKRLWEVAPAPMKAKHGEELMRELVAATATAHPSAKHHRLKCLGGLLLSMLRGEVKGVRGDGEGAEVDAMTAVLSEVIVAVKESNRKAREEAYRVLLGVAHALKEKDEEEAEEGVAGVKAVSFADERMEGAAGGGGGGGGGRRLMQFFTMVLAGLAGSTPRMMSATVMALARLLFEFSSSLLHTVPQLLPAVLLLLRSKSREIIKAVLGFSKVVVVRVPGEELVDMLPQLVEGLLLWCDDSKNHFKAKVRVIMERLVRRCGHNEVVRHVPDQHQRLLTHMRKARERKQKQREEARKARGPRRGRPEGVAEDDDDAKSVRSSRASTARKSQWDHTDIFDGSSMADLSDDDMMDDDDGDDDGVSTRATSMGRSTLHSRSAAGSSGGGVHALSSLASRSKRRARKARMAADDTEAAGAAAGPLNLLDIGRTRRALHGEVEPSRKRRNTDDEEMQVAEDGRLVVEEPGQGKKVGLGGDGDANGMRGIEVGEEDEDEGGVRPGKKVAKQRKLEGGRKKMKAVVKGAGRSGEEYAPRNAGTKGDVKRAGRFEPHAYWPLDAKMLNRREGKVAKARKGMASTLNMRDGGGGRGRGTGRSSRGRGGSTHRGRGKSRG